LEDSLSSLIKAESSNEGSNGHGDQTSEESPRISGIERCRIKPGGKNFEEFACLNSEPSSSTPAYQIFDESLAGIDNTDFFHEFWWWGARWLLSEPVNSNSKGDDTIGDIPPFLLISIDEVITKKPSSEDGHWLLESKDAVDLTGMGALADVVASTDVRELTSDCHTQTEVRDCTTPEMSPVPLINNGWFGTYWRNCIGDLCRPCREALCSYLVITKRVPTASSSTIT